MMVLPRPIEGYICSSSVDPSTPSTLSSIQEQQKQHGQNDKDMGIKKEKYQFDYEIYCQEWNRWYRQDLPRKVLKFQVKSRPDRYAQFARIMKYHES